MGTCLMTKMKFIHFQSFLKTFNFLVSNDCGDVSCLTPLPFPHDHCLLSFDQNIHISYMQWTCWPVWLTESRLPWLLQWPCGGWMEYEDCLLFWNFCGSCDWRNIYSLFTRSWVSFVFWKMFWNVQISRWLLSWSFETSHFLKPDKYLNLSSV